MRRPPPRSSTARPANTVPLRRLPLIALALALLACSQDEALPFSARSSSIVLADPEHHLLAVTSPDEDRVVLLDAHDLRITTSIPLTGGPAHVLRHGERLFVTLDADSAVAVIPFLDGDPTPMRIPVPCGRTEGIVPLGPGPDDPIVVSCPDDRRLVLLDPAQDALAVRATIVLDHAPSPPAVLGNSLSVTFPARGKIAHLPTAALRTAHGTTTLDHTTETISTAPGRTATNAFLLLPDPHRNAIHAIHDAVDNDGDRNRPPAQGSYGEVVDGNPRIEPRIHGPCVDAYARFDGGNRVFSGASTAALSPDGQHLWIAHTGTRNLVQLPCRDDGASTPNILRIGAGARGIALSDDGGLLWIDLGFDLAVTRVDLARGETRTARRIPEQHRYSAEAQRGRRLFFDATNTHLTPSGIVACATCHPGGREDGLSWFLHTPGVSRRLVRTPPAWALKPELLPAHRDGEFQDGSLLVRHTIRELMGGDGLVIDAAAMVAWMHESAPPHPRPPDNPQEAALRQRGARVFDTAGCASCHHGPWYTDNARHHVVPPSTDPDARIAGGVVTPTLRGVRTRAPFLHDGRAPSLRALWTAHNPQNTHGTTGALPDSDLDALLAFLESL